jgi:ribosomal protein L40E
VSDGNYCRKCGAQIKEVTHSSVKRPNCSRYIEDKPQCPYCDYLRADAPTPPFDTCKNCGAPIDDDADYCGQCGTHGESTGQAETPPPDLVLDGPGTPIRVGDGDIVGIELRKRAHDAGLSRREVRMISREHARFARRDDGFYVTHLGTNSLEIDGESLATGDTHPVQMGDSIVYAGVIETVVKEG